MLAKIFKTIKTSLVSSFMSCFTFSDVEHQKKVPKVQTKHKTRILSRCKVQSQFFYMNFENFQLYQSQESPRKKAPVFYMKSTLLHKTSTFRCQNRLVKKEFNPSFYKQMEVAWKFKASNSIWKNYINVRLKSMTKNRIFDFLSRFPEKFQKFEYGFLVTWHQLIILV